MGGNKRSPSTYQQHKEYKEDIGDKVYRPQDPVGVVDSIVVKVTQDDPKLGKAEPQKRSEVGWLIGHSRNYR